MATNRIEVELGISADVSSAKRAISNLEDSLSKLYKKQEQNGFQDLGLNEAVKTAKELEVCLSRALNQKTGKLDISAFQNGLKSAGLSMDQLNQKLLSAGPAGQQVFTSLASSIAQAEIPLKRTNKLVSEFTRSIKNVFTYQISASMFQAVAGALSDAVNYTKELNSSLNDIRIVTGQSSAQMAKFAVEANKSAQKLSTTTNNYAKASLIFYQQGLNDAEVKKRTDAVVKMANVTKESMGDVSSYMTAIWNNFDDGTESLEHYADVMTALGATTASSTKEIAAGLEKFASIGKTIGLSYEYATSAVATIVDKTRQSAETVGTGLRTIFSRLQGLSLGETLEDGVDLNKYSSALKTVGVNILDASGNMKEMDTILDSLAVKWGNLSTAQKTALAQTVGGVRQYTTLISLMDNWDSMKQNINTANTADGSLQSQQDIYAEGWEAASQRSKAALEGLYQTLLNDKGFIALTDGLTSITKAVTTLVSAMGGLPGILSTIGMIATKVFSKQITQGVRGATDKLTTWGSQFKGQGFWKSAGQIIRGQSNSAAQVRAGQAFAAQERSYSAQMEYMRGRGQQRSVEYMAAEQAQTLIGRKRKLMENEGRLTEEERIRAQDKINALSEAHERRLALRQEKDQQSKEFSKLEDRAATDLLSANVSWEKTQGDNAGQTRTADEQLKRLYYLSGLQGTGQWQVSGRASADTRREQLQNMVSDARLNARKQTLAQSFLDSGMMADESQRSNTIAQINEAFGETVVGEDASLEEVQTKLQQIISDATAARAAMDDLIKVSDTDNNEQKEAKKKVKNLLDKAEEQGQEQASRDKEAGHVAGEIKGHEQEIDGLINGEKKIGDKLAAGIEKATATVGGLVTGFTQAKSAMEVLGDAGASVGDQIAAGMSMASGAVTAFATGGPWAAVAYLVGVVGSIAVDALIKQFNAAEIAAQKAEAVSASLNAAAEEAAGRLNAIQSAVDGYEGAIETLNSCTKGTQEWSEALKNVHSSITELLTEFPELMEYSNLFNTDGTLNQDVLDQAVEKAKTASVAANAAAAQGQIEARRARLEANTVSYSREYTRYYQTADQYGNTYVEDYNSGYNDNNKYTRTVRGDLDAILNSYQLFGSEALELGDVYAILENEIGGNIDITEEYAQSLLDLANQSVSATTMMNNATKSIVTDWATANGTDLITGQAEFMGAAYNEAYDTFSKAIQDASDSNSKADNKDHSVLGKAFDNTTFKGMSVTEAFNHARGTNYQLASNGVRGVDSNRTYVYLEDGKESIYKIEEMKATIAAAAALERMGAEAAKAKEKIANISENLVGPDATGEEKVRAQSQEVGLQNYIANRNLESMTQSDFEDMQNTVTEMGGASAYLQKAFNMTEDQIIKTFGEDFITNFENTLDKTETAWKDAWGNNEQVAKEALGEVTNEMSLSNVAKLSDYMDEFSLGPAGEAAGAQFVEGLKKMISKENLSVEDQNTILNDLLTTVDWTSYDAFDQAQVVLKKYGITINETDAYWQKFIADMRLASGAIPDFSKIKTDLNSVSEIVKDLKFGDIIDEEDYQALIAYNDEWERFFLLQADGSRQFIGNAEDFNKFIQEKTIANREEIDLRRTVSELEGIEDVKWSEGGDAVKAAFDEYMKDDSFRALMEKMGYTSDMISSMTAEQLKEMYTRIGEAVNANQIELDQSEFEQMIASMATSFTDLNTLYTDGTIGIDAYSRALLSMASGYEYCTSAVEAYQKAVASGVGVDEAREILEKAVAVEQEAEKYSSAYSNALSGRNSMSVADLNALEEADPELYYQYLTATEDEWYEASYESYRNWLDSRMAGYSEDSAEYKALMMERNQLDEDYYDVQEEKALKHLELLREKYDENIENITTAQSSIASIFEGNKTPTFSALGELRRELLELGYDATQVGEIIQNLGKSDKEDKTKEDILTQLGLETELSLNKLTQMGKMERNYGNAIGVTIEDYQFAPSVPSEGKEMKVPATSNPKVTPETPSDIPGLKWENNQYNFKATGGGSIVINGTTGKGIKEVGEDSITLVDPTPGGGTIEVNATEGTPLAASLTDKGWVIKDPTQNGAGEILVNGKPGTNTGVTLQGNVWKLTSVSSEGKQASISVVGSPNTTTGVKYENNQWQITAVTSEGASATIAVGGDGGDASVEFDETTGWKITGTTVGGGTSTINVASDGGTKGVTWTEKGWQLVGEDPTGKSSTITVSGDTDPSTGIDYVANKGWVISGTVNGEDTNITVSGAADNTTVSFDGKKYTLKQKGEGSGSLVVDAKSFDSATIESLGEDGGYIIKGLGKGSGSLTVGAIPDNSTVELIEDGTGYKLRGTVNGEAFECPVTAEEVEKGAKVHWVDGKGWVLEQTVETKYETTSGQAPETEVHQTVYVSYVDEETQAGLHRSAQLRRTLEWLDYDGKVSDGYFTDIYDGSKTSKVYTWGAEVNRTKDKSTWGFDTAREFFRSLYGVGDKNNVGADAWADLMGNTTGTDSALSLAMGALEYGPGAGQWLKDFGNFGYSRASYKYATESIGEQLNEWRAKIINSMSGVTNKTGLDKWGSFNATELLNMGLSQKEIDAIVAEYNQVYETLMAQEGMTVERAVQGASEAITDNLTQYLNADSTYVYGMNLYQGLIQGWQDAYGNATTFADTALSVLGDLANAFEIHSPSRATRRMGVWLMQGLNEGWKDTTFDANNIGDMALSAIKTSLSEAFGGEGINWLEYLQTDKDGNLIKLMTQEQLDSIWGDRETNDYLTGDENDTNAKTNSLNRIATMFDKDGTVGFNADEMNAFLAELPQQLQDAVKQWQAQNPEAQLTMDVIAELAINTEDLADNWDETMLQDLLLGEASGEALANYITNGYLDTITDPTTKALFAEAKKDFFEKNDQGIKTDLDINEGNAQVVLDHIYQYMAENLDKYRTLIDAEIDNMLTKWTTALSELYAEETEYAKNLVTMWTETYSTIAKIRTALLSDSNATVMSVVGDDIDSLTQLIANARMNGTTDAAALFNKWYYGTGMTETDASLTAFNAPTQLWGESEYGLISKAFSFDANGMINFGQKWTDFNTQQTEIVSGLVDKYLVGDGSIVQEQINKLYEAAADTSDPESASSAQLLLEILTNKGIITANKNQDNQVTGYSINANAGETQGITIKDLLVEEVGLDEAGFYNAQNALWAYESARRNREGQAAADRGEARLEAATNKIDLLTRAASGEEADSFSAQEQAEIYKILGIDPSSVSFEELLTSMPDLIVRALNTATKEAETAGKTAAAEHYLAGQGYVNVNGQWRQYSYDPQEMIAKSIGADGTPSTEMVSRYRVGENGQVQKYNQTTQQYETATVENLTVTIDGATLTQALTTGGFTASVNTDGSLNVSNVGSYTVPDNDNLNGAAAGNVGTDARSKIDEAWSEMDEFIRLAESAGLLMSAEDIAADHNIELSEAIALQRQYATQLKRMESGLKTLNSSGKNWIKTLKKQDASLEEQADAIKNLRKNYADVLGLTNTQAKKLSKTFLENENNLKLVADAAEETGEKGQKALDQLQALAAEDLYENSDIGEMSNDLVALANQISSMKFNAGDMITGTDEAYGTLTSFWQNIVTDAMNAGKSFEQATAIANDAMNALGYDVEPLQFETVEMSAEALQKHISTSSTPVTVLGPNGQPMTVTIDNIDEVITPGSATTYTVQIPKGKNGSGGGVPSGYTKLGEKTGGGRRSGGGGGGSRRRYLAKAKPEDHKERYHEINNALDEVTDALERLNKQQDRAWGAERLKSMQAESAELKKQADLIRQKTQEAQDYLESDLTAALEAGWTFDEEGNVSNYEDHWDKLLADYNNAVEEYNNMSIAEQEAIDKKFEEANDKYYEAKAKGDTAGMEEWGEYINPETEVAFGSYEEYLKYKMLDAPTEALEQYEETMEELEQLGIDYDDVLNSLYDNFIDQVQTKWDTANEIADANIEYLEHKISRLEDDAYQAAETIGLMSDKMDYTQDKFNAATTALDDLLKGYDSAWSAEAIMAGQLTAEDLAGAGMDANAVEMVQSIMSELMNLEQEMTDTLIESFESMTEAFDEFNEDLDRYISTIEHAQSITSTYRNIIDLTGKSMSGFSTEMLKAFNNATIDQAKANMKSNKTKYDTVQAEYDEAYQQYLNAQNLHAQGQLTDAALESAKKAFEATQDNLNEAQEAYVASWEAALQAVADSYTSTMEGVMDEISKNLANGLAGGLDALQERMDRMKTKDSNYVDDYEKIYQLTKLTRDLETQIDNTSNVRAQKELLKFQKEINSILQSDKKLSEYDIDYLQKKYDLKLAEIALEDAQNAKSQVTMRRDSEGNYNYVYTADENAVAEAEAEYATKLYEMQKANDEYITSLSDSIVSLEAEMKDALLALDPTQFASEEEFNAAVEEIIAFYTEQMSYHQEQLETVLGNNKELYEKDMVWYNKYANYKMADAASFIDSWNETLLAQATGFETMEDLFGTFFSQAETAQSESVTAYRNYVDAINAINAEAGHPTETLAQSLTEDIEAMTDQAEQAATDMEQHAETIVGEITSIGQAIEDMAKKFGVEIVGMAKQTDLLVAALTDMLEIMGKAGDIELEEGLLADIEARRQAREQEYASQSFDTGGYTGTWGPEGKLAWLHQKELVLNAADTENILASVGILRQIANTIDLNALTSAGGFISLMSSGISGNKETLQQEVHIEASFPAVTDKNQIEDAFTDLVNLAAQYANRK